MVHKAGQYGVRVILKSPDDFYLEWKQDFLLINESSAQELKLQRLIELQKEIRLGRPSDKDRVIWLLSEQGGTSNQQVKGSLDLSDSRYTQVIEDLWSEGLIEKYRCRGGGIRLRTGRIFSAISRGESRLIIPRPRREI